MAQTTRMALCSILGLLLNGEVTGEVRRVPLQSSITRVQPMTGIVLWSDNEEAATEAVALEYRYCGYNEVVRPNGEYDFSKIDEVLDQIAGRRHQAVLRFYFVYVGRPTTVPESVRRQAGYAEIVGQSEGQPTHFCDWSSTALQEFTLEFYSRLAERYDRDRRVAFLQTGFGLWAEYHIYDGPRKIGKTFPSKAFQARFLKHLDRAFTSLPWSISIDAADYDYSPLEGNQPLLSLSFGLFDDSFLCKSHSRENAVNWRTLDPDRWKRCPAGGEFSYYTRRDQRMALAENGPHGESFADAARRFHVTYMIGNDQLNYRSVEQLAAASSATGYRFRVTSATRENDLLRLQVANDGVAPIYRDAFFVAGAKRAEVSLRRLLPGATMTCEIPRVTDQDVRKITIQCDSILPSQAIQFEADLR